MEGNSVTTRHGNWLKEQLYLDYCVTDYVIVQRNKERTLKKKCYMRRYEKYKICTEYIVHYSLVFCLKFVVHIYKKTAKRK